MTRPPSLWDLQRPQSIADPWPLYRQLPAGEEPTWDRGVGSWLVARHADGSRLLPHPRLRQVLGDPFKPRHVQALSQWITAIVDEVLDRCAGTPRMDVVAGLALP